MSTDNLRMKNRTTSMIHLIWINSKSILLDRINEYYLKIKGVSLHSLQIGTTHITISCKCSQQLSLPIKLFCYEYNA